MSGTLPPDTSTPYSPIRRVEAYNDPQACASEIFSAERSTLNTRGAGEYVSEVHSNGISVSSNLNKHDVGEKFQTCGSSVIKVGHLEKLPSDGMSSCETSLAAFMDNSQDIMPPSSNTRFIDFSKSHNLSIDKSLNHNTTREVEGLCSGLSSISTCHLEDTCSASDSDSQLFSDNSTNSSGRKQMLQDNQYSDEQSTWPALWEDMIVGDLQNIDYGQPRCCKGINNVSSGISSAGLPLNLEQASPQLWLQGKNCCQNPLGKPSHYLDEPLETAREQVEGNDNVKGVNNKVSPDMAESSIISNILSLEFDAWEDSLTKLLGKNDAQCTSLKSPTMRKVQDKNQSRFSFAREDEFLNEACNLEHSLGLTGNSPNKQFASGGFMGNKDTVIGKDRHVLQSISSVDDLVRSQSFVPSKLSGEC